MFRNREDAARQLDSRLKGRLFQDPLVLAIPRGGVVIGAVLAQASGADLDVVLSRKLRAPGMPESALGAIGEDGQVYLDRHVEEMFGPLSDYLIKEREHQIAEIARRKALYRPTRPAAAIAGRSVIVVDDGIATGSTMIAALRVAQAQDPYELIVAVPVASAKRLEEVRRWCDEVVCLDCPHDFRAIGQFYQDFRQVEDEEVLAILRRFTSVPEQAAAAGSRPVRKRNKRRVPVNGSI
jgi:hypothetical protein